ncbi:uncharacterized protein RtGEF isoform X1 [Euwallacea similis]|uniref:uncharacterized protein RtGEF isoform X1 n=1 Tax=Euwallacea similis TaxID=1736056 RepID=UPI00344B5D4B
MAAGEPIVVQALYTFKRSNNDELCFKKGDVITVTQKDDGWWEGTLDGKTGWFPSNYVKECKDIPQPSVKQDNEYKSVVLKDIIDSERTHVEELEGLLTKYLQPLEKSSLLSQDEFKQLTSNFTEVLETHRQLLLLVEQESAKPGQDQRVGKLYLNWAPKIKAVHQMYCSLHPRAVVILDKFKEELSKYMESRGAVAPGVLVLTTLLSKPFRRLDKYSGLLQELERHLEECHPDRGDTQRSVSIYKDIATTCLATRRQKELELQVLTGPIRGWEGPNLTKLGEIIYMGSVAVGQHHHDRYFVLFPTTLVILSVSHRTSAFIYEGKLFLAGLTVTPLEDTETIKNAFEIGTPMIEKRVVICQSRQEADHWLELLMNSQGSRSSTSSQKVLPSQAQYVPQPPPHLNQRGYSTRSSVMSYTPPLGYTPTYPAAFYPAAAPYASLSKYYARKIKEHVLTRRVLRYLLYAEHFNKRNLNAVKIRHHKTEVVIMTKNVHLRDSVINCGSDSDDTSDSSEEEFGNLRRQNALEANDSSSSTSSCNPFGYIRYYNPKTEAVKFESFVDYGQPLKVLEDPPQKPSIILTSTAKLNLLHKQHSEESEASSTPAARRPGYACENLLALGESFELNMLDVPESYLPMTRQSCPTKLVGNKFNESSLTTVYIPPWSSSENNITCRRDSPQSSECSSLELPVNTMPLPDRMVAELLYGEFAKSESVESDLTEQSQKTVIKPSSAVSLNLEHIPFRKHSINSDKPRQSRRSSIQINPSDLKEKALRRCITSRFLNMQPNPEQPSTSSDKRSHLCRCGSEYCHSPRSSDSGMAGSCTLNSPDLANIADRDSNVALDRNLEDGLTLSEIEARNFESQCPCSSPFGSTPRTSSETGPTRDSLRTTSVTSMDILSPVQAHSRISVSSRKLLGKSKSTSSLLGGSDKACSSIGEGGEIEEDSPMFKSGLYAHWWLKAKLPPEVVRGIYEETHSNQRKAGKGACTCIF